MISCIKSISYESYLSESIVCCFSGKASATPRPLYHINLERCITIQYICWDDSDKDIVKMGNHFVTLDEDNVRFDKVKEYMYPPIFDDGPSPMMAHLFLSQVYWW